MKKTRYITSKTYPSNFHTTDVIQIAANVSGTKFFSFHREYNGSFCHSNRKPDYLSFLSHSIEEDRTESFRSWDFLEPTCSMFHLKQRFFGFYCLSDNMVGLVKFEDSFLTQYVIEFVPRGGRNSSGKQEKRCTCPNVEYCKHWGYAEILCTRRKTIMGVHKMCLGLSLLSSGRVIICGTSETERSKEAQLTEVQWISADPMRVDQYADQNLSAEIAKVTFLSSASEVKLAFSPPISLMDGSMYFWIQATSVRYPYRHFDSTVMASLYKDVDNKYVAQLIPFDNTEVKYPEEIRGKLANISNGIHSYVAYIRSDDGHYSLLKHVAKGIQKAVKTKLDEWVKPQQFSFTEYGTVSAESELWPPCVYFMYSIDFVLKKFCRISCQVQVAAQKPFFTPTSNGDLSIISVPRNPIDGPGAYRDYLLTTVIEGAASTPQKRDDDRTHSQAPRDKKGLGKRLLNTIKKPFVEQHEKM